MKRRENRNKKGEIKKRKVVGGTETFFSILTATLFNAVFPPPPKGYYHLKHTRVGGLNREWTFCTRSLRGALQL